LVKIKEFENFQYEIENALEIVASFIEGDT
jgi:hypothetical protein